TVVGAAPLPTRRAPVLVTAPIPGSGRHPTGGAPGSSIVVIGVVSAVRRRLTYTMPATRFIRATPDEADKDHAALSSEVMSRHPVSPSVTAHPVLPVPAVLRQTRA